PVKNGQAGVNRLLSVFGSFPGPNRPGCVIVVDNLSNPKLTLTPHETLSVQLLRCDTPGPAAARNVGWRATEKPWILFMDADCVPTVDLIPSFIRATN